MALGPHAVAGAQSNSSNNDDHPQADGIRTLEQGIWSSPGQMHKMGLEGFCEFSVSDGPSERERELGLAPGHQLAILSFGS